MVQIKSLSPGVVHFNAAYSILMSNLGSHNKCSAGQHRSESFSTAFHGSSAPVISQSWPLGGLINLSMILFLSVRNARVQNI